MLQKRPDFTICRAFFSSVDGAWSKSKLMRSWSNLMRMHRSAARSRQVTQLITHEVPLIGIRILLLLPPLLYIPARSASIRHTGWFLYPWKMNRFLVQGCKSNIFKLPVLLLQVCPIEELHITYTIIYTTSWFYFPLFSFFFTGNAFKFVSSSKRV